MIKLTVVVPVKNEEDNIANLLDSIKAQTVKPDEVILVDNHSEDKTIEIAQPYFSSREVNGYIYEAGHKPTIGELRHIGTMLAESCIILSTDADIIFPPKHIERIKKYFEQDENLVLLTGPVVDTERRPLQTFSTIIGSVIFFGLGGNTAFRKSIYEKTDGYAFISNGEDVILSQQLLRHGKFHYDPSLLVEHTSKIKWLLSPLVILGGIGAYTSSFNKPLGSLILGGTLGFGIPEVAKELNTRLTVSDIHIHHDIVGVIMIGSSVASQAFKLLPTYANTFIGGAGLGSLLQHIMSEPPCDEHNKEFCLFPWSRD